MTKEEKAQIVINQLKKDYPVVETPLVHKNAYELLIAVILSTQTNDNTTNQVTPQLFRDYAEPRLLAQAKFEDVANKIKLVNYYKTKSKHIISTASIITSEYNSQVPSCMSELLKLPGVGRKVANVVISEWFAKPAPSPAVKAFRRQHGFPPIQKPDDFVPIEPEGFVVDTHVLRVSRMLGLTDSTNPSKVEIELMRLFPKSEWVDTSLRMIFHGREVNSAKNSKIDKYPVWKSIYGIKVS